MRITINHELIVYPLQSPSGDSCKCLTPGTYKVESAGFIDGELWWRVEGDQFGNSADCWQAVRRAADTLSRRLEVLAKKTALLVSLCLLALSFVKTDWTYVKSPPDLPSFANRRTAWLAQVTKGAVYSVQPQVNGEYLVSRYASSWQLLHETLHSFRQSPPFLQNHLVQIHKDLLLLLIIAMIPFRHFRLTMCGLIFLLPVLILGILGAPVSDPKWSQPTAVYYLIIGGAATALIWNSYDGNEEGEPAWFWKTVSSLAMAYNGFMLFFMLAPRVM